MNIDPNRLLMVIRDRHILVERLEMALADSKKDGMGDAFRINALLKVQRENLKELEDQLKSMTASPEMLHAMKLADKKKADQAAVCRMRVEINQWVDYQSKKNMEVQGEMVQLKVGV